MEEEAYEETEEEKEEDESQVQVDLPHLQMNRSRIFSNLFSCSLWRLVNPGKKTDQETF